MINLVFSFQITISQDYRLSSSPFYTSITLGEVVDLSGINALEEDLHVASKLNLSDMFQLGLRPEYVINVIHIY